MIDTDLARTLATPPDRSEAADYYFKYIDLVPPGNICDVLAAQRTSTVAFFGGISALQSRTTYEPGKWTVAETLSHVIDAERLFIFRAWWFARGLEAPLPSFDQEVVANIARERERPWRTEVQHFNIVRKATLAFFEGLSLKGWLRSGSASGNMFSVRALAYLTAGHVIHHTQLVRERYGG